jgi:hypothetical protein|tara:strand:+ start:92 stop:370 length:279 start_codon:yes stop_codon:yes gene_type:complete
MSKKLTDTELESIQKSQNDFTKAKLRIADVEMQKAGILQELDKIKSEFAVFEQELIKKYGKDSSINMQTGEVRTVEEIKAEAEKEKESEKKE